MPFLQNSKKGAKRVSEGSDLNCFSVIFRATTLTGSKSTVSITCILNKTKITHKRKDLALRDYSSYFLRQCLSPIKTGTAAELANYITMFFRLTRSV